MSSLLNLLDVLYKLELQEAAIHARMIGASSPDTASRTESNTWPAETAAKSSMRNDKAGVSTWTALHPTVLERLPDYIKLQLPITFTSHGAIDRSMLDMLTHTVMHGGTFTAASQGIADACKRREQRHQQLYMQYQLAQQQSGRQALSPALLQQTQAGDSQATNSSKHLPVSTSFQPSRQWLSVVWLEAMRPNIDWANRYMSTVKGRFWCMDYTFATAKYIRDAEQKSVYKAVLTIVNEHSQLVSQWFTQTTSLYEVRKGLRLLRDRYRGEDVEVSTAASSCACCPHCMPELLQTDTCSGMKLTEM